MMRFALILVLSTAAAAQDVRPITYRPQAPEFALNHGGKNKLITFTDQAGLENALGKTDAQALAAKVDFAKEKLVLVSWTTSGPPEGKLQSEVKKKGDAKTVQFYVQAPAATIRGQRARLGADFFAVPKDWDVEFDPKERK